MGRRLAAAVMGACLLLTATVSPAAAYYNEGWVNSVHCNAKWTISSAYQGANIATLKFTKGDPLANCAALKIEMKWQYYAGASTMYTATKTIDTPSPRTASYTNTLEKNGVYCVTVQFWVLIAPGAHRNSGWVAC
jgi:hypothetical protein